MRTVRFSVATLALAALVIANTTATNSITYVVGNWQITLTDLGVLPGGTASSALAINNAGRIVGLATDSTFRAAAAFLGREQRSHYRVRPERRFRRHGSARADQ